MKCLYVFTLSLLILLLTSACGSSGTTEESLDTNYNGADITTSYEVNHNTEDTITHEYNISVSSPYELTLDYAIQRANNRRNNISNVDMDRLWELIQWQEPLSIDLLRFVSGYRVSSLSREEAIYDANIMFEMLRHFYGGYNFLGGDEVFLPLFEDILEAINEQEQWSGSMFLQLLRDYLSTVIADNHFHIESHSLGVSYYVFIWDTPFERSEQGFRKQDTSLYLVDIVGYDKQDIFRLSVDEEGNFFYSAIFMKPESKGIIYDFDVVWSNGELETISLLRTPLSPTISGGEPSLHYVNDIPIVTFRTGMGNPFSYTRYIDEYARRFISLAEYLYDESVIIIDIRTNPGGFSMLTRLWLDILLGEIVPNNFTILDSHWWEDIPQMPEEWYEVFGLVSDEYLEKYNELFERHDPSEYIGNYHFFSTFPNQTIPNDILLILLVDRYTFSAGEFFTDQMLNIENTLVIGQNTGGALLTSSFPPLYLPNSGISYIMGPAHFAFHENDWREGVGIDPDIWVIGDALTAALAILEGRK